LIVFIFFPLTVEMSGGGTPSRSIDWLNFNLLFSLIL